MDLIPGPYKEYWTGSRATKEPGTQNKQSLSLNDFDRQSKQINSEFKGQTEMQVSQLSRITEMTEFKPKAYNGFSRKSAYSLR